MNFQVIEISAYSVSLSWIILTVDIGEVVYEVFRNGVLIDTIGGKDTSTTSFSDEYHSVTKILSNNSISDSSAVLRATHVSYRLKKPK